jgi:hypothetical protein
MALAVFQQLDPASLYMERVLGYEAGMGLVQPVMFSTPGNQTTPQLPGGIRALRFPKITQGATGTAGAAANVPSGIQTLGATFFLGIPVAMTTGLTFIVQCTDDGTNPADLGQTAIFAVQTKVITSTSYLHFGIPNYATTTPFLSPGGGSGANAIGVETSGNVSLNVSPGIYSSTSIQIITANLGNAAAVNSVVLCRLRRVGMAATDTLQGSILVTGVSVGTY